MHPIGFQFKRAHLSTVAVGRKIFRGTRKVEDPDFDGVPDMTPARFDILYLIYGGQLTQMFGEPRGRRVTMAELTRLLGLSRATISVAIERLVELGLVRKGAFRGKNGTLVDLTKEGYRRIRRAFDLIFRQGKLARRIGGYFDAGIRSQGWRTVIDHKLDLAWRLIRALAGTLGDTSQPIYLFRLEAVCDDDA